MKSEKALHEIGKSPAWSGNMFHTLFRDFLQTAEPTSYYIITEKAVSGKDSSHSLFKTNYGQD